ncbi:mannitol-1-phosphate 5-dehydrogenase [Paraliobacillus quinghaiensis]|uniref:Mannitol-1-phosphate 5-dehydrogenase n=1 Tax=Paraliobacillus quinghaiensis TaxID=470815 RepID=A0A917WTD8_9BACI|nr:mannitol-1-phosphate 5-dehydrogenase [Paraliobacillus quinghaiensis]GGM30401.1 mannitol-1-phosphate 5-dehydrogenase [Paraliobacillus quinghaiensis]
MQALHFGAGNIGKGFIGSLLNKTGYDVCFVDVNQEVVDNFNRNNRYLVEILDDNHTIEVVSPVTALNGALQVEEVVEGVINADIITTSVGIDNLSRIAKVIATGLLRRLKENKDKLDIIANENAVNATTTLKQEIAKHVSEKDMEEIILNVGFPNSAIDRLALSKESDTDEIALVEPFYEWVINKKEMVNLNSPPIKGALYVDDLNPYIERKLYSVNMGHATAAYIGFINNEKTVQSALSNPEIEEFVRGTLNETAQYLIRKFEVNEKDMNDYIEKTLSRFKNKNVKDDVLRVGRSPIRKLGCGERLVKPTQELLKHELPVNHLIKVIAAAFLFDNPKDEESKTLKQYVRDNGIDNAIVHFTKIENERIRNAIIENYNHFKNNKEMLI